MSSKRNFYRRPLPNVCIDFASERGKQIFKDALLSDYMNCYFPLASQYRTQDEPAYCGLSSLVMVLNALAVDPGVVWKGVFRWYHEEMLDCCIPLEDVKLKGVTMDDLLCLAVCNQLDGTLHRVSDESCLSKFREEVKSVCSRSDQAIILSYGRNILGQTGSGHFSPVGGYNVKEDMVLIFDVARFKYPPYWLPLSELWKAMMSVDTETGLHRGYLTVWRANDASSLSLSPIIFRISKTISPLKSPMAELTPFLKNMKSFLAQKIPENTREDDALKDLLIKLLKESSLLVKEGIGEGNANVDSYTSIQFLSLKLTNEQLKEFMPEHLNAIQNLVKAIMDTKLFKKIAALIPPNLTCWRMLFDEETKFDFSKSCCKNNTICNEPCVICIPHYLTVFLLSFLSEKRKCIKKESSTKSEDDTGTYSSILQETIRADLDDGCVKCAKLSTSADQGHRLLLNEISQLSKHFSALLSKYEC